MTFEADNEPDDDGLGFFRGLGISLLITGVAAAAAAVILIVRLLT